MLNQTTYYTREANNEMEHNTDITSQLESTTLKHENVHGGNAFMANTLLDSGFEPMLGPKENQCQRKGHAKSKKRQLF
jgi:hypothetical protein